MTLTDFIRAMPKVELHVHFQGATQPETLHKLARHNGITLPANDLDEWYRFTTADHFFATYDLICTCFCTEDDLELAMREFIQGQAQQNIVYTEVTYTPNRRMPFDRQLAALNRGRAWGEAEYGVQVRYVIDIPREVSPEDGLMIADWAISGMDQGVVAFGLGGAEHDDPAEKFTDAFARTRAAGLPSVPHAGETAGPESIWAALDILHAERIGHGVRCLEDPALVDELRQRQIPLEVCPTSNVCLGMVQRLEDHPLPRLMAAGLQVTINSDDPPMFNTTLTDEYIRVAEAFAFDQQTLTGLMLNAVNASFAEQQLLSRFLEKEG
jgi:adenosine deaminase